jgi:polygalacturonase
VKPSIVNIKDFGAIGNRISNDAPAIQAAIDHLAAQGGGTVLVPPGEYLCGPIRLKSHITLHLTASATLYASRRREDYDAQSKGVFLAADDAENVTVEGAGALHGQAPEDLLRGAKQRPDFRTRLVLFTNCRNVQVRNIRMLYSDSWTLHLKRCSDVVIDGITIFNNIDRINSDGIDPDSCRNVRISNCHIVAGDDCIVLKCTTAHTCENVVVTNCTLESGATAIKLGTESHAAFRDVHFSNCTINRSSGGIGLFVKDGACMERLTFSNISITDRDNESVASGAAPIFMDIERRHADSPLGHIRDVVLNGIQIHSRFPSLIQGTPESYIENLTIRDLSHRVEQWQDFSQRKKRGGGVRTTSDERDTLFARQPAYLTLAYVDDLTLDNVRIDITPEVYAIEPRAAVSLHHTRNVCLHRVRRIPDSNEEPMPAVRRDC